MTEGAKSHLESYPAWGGEGNNSKFSNHNSSDVVHYPVLSTGSMNFTWEKSEWKRKLVIMLAYKWTPLVPTTKSQAKEKETN